MHPRLVFLLFYVSATAALVHFDLRSLEPFKTDSRYGSILLKVIDCAAWRESIAAVLPRARIFCFDELNLSKKAGMVVRVYARKGVVLLRSLPLTGHVPHRTGRL